MFNNEQSGAQMWRKMLTENFHVENQEKLDWVSQYAAIHEAFEGATLGVNTFAGNPGAVPQQGVGPVYTTPLNTVGMGNPYAPSQMPTQGQQMSDFWKQTPGSGDIPMSTLSMALNVALLTIGLELVPVVPAKAPWLMLSYMDFPYAGGKLGRVNETSFDGRGVGKENKPIYVKVLGLLGATEENAETGVKAADGLAKLIDDFKKNVKVGDEVTVTGAKAVFTGKFKGFGRNDGGLLLETVSCVLTEAATGVAVENGLYGVTGEVKDGKAASITEVFEDGFVTVASGSVSVTLTEAKADFVQTSADFVDGFANFVDGREAPMTRAENETGTGNTIGLRLFTKWIQMGAYEVTGSVTRQQLQDLPLYGVNAQAKIMEAMQNELTQHINARILERVFALGVTNAIQQKAFQNIDLNLYMADAGEEVAMATSPVFAGIKHMKDIYGYDHKADLVVKNTEVITSAENLHTRQRRIASRILAAANIIQVTGRRGRANWAVTNSQVATALQDVSGYVVAPMANNFAQDGTQNLYMGGTYAGVKIYVDPYMAWDDCRICVGRKGDANTPGVIFCPYILADTVQIVAEGTMAPKFLVNSRYAIAEIGFYPELQYLTFAVGSTFGII